MKKISFTHTFVFPKDAVLGFALFLGYSEKINQETFNTDTSSLEPHIVDNPETPVDYVARLSREHSLVFTTKWANYLANKELERQIEIIKPQIDSVFIEPINQALDVNVEEID